MDNSFQDLLHYIEQTTTFRCQHYKEKPLKRRVRVRMRALGFEDFRDYHVYVKDNPAEVEKLIDTLTINLSFFFRNPETFVYLQNTLLPPFKQRDAHIAVWSAGCARGEEAYSLAITAAEVGLLHKATVYGTDIDAQTLAQARTGEYPASAFQYTPQHIVAKYFQRTDGTMVVRDDLKHRVRFVQCDLFDMPPFELCDLIMCRNVLIYLRREAQSIVLRNFHHQLKPGGYLALGKVELLFAMPEATLFEITDRSEHIYRKLNG